MIETDAVEHQALVTTLMGGLQSATVDISTADQNSTSRPHGPVIVRWEPTDTDTIWFGIRDGEPVGFRIRGAGHDLRYVVHSVDWEPTIPTGFFTASGGITAAQRESLSQLVTR